MDLTALRAGLQRRRRTSAAAARGPSSSVAKLEAKRTAQRDAALRISAKAEADALRDEERLAAAKDGFFAIGIDKLFAALGAMTFRSHFVDVTRDEARVIVAEYKAWEASGRSADERALRLDLPAALLPLAARIDAVIAAHFAASGVFVKLSTRSPKDSPLAFETGKAKYLAALRRGGGPGDFNARLRLLSDCVKNSLKCHCGREALLHMTHSLRVAEDLEDAERRVADSDASASDLSAEVRIAVREYVRCPIEAEFRGFVWDGKLTCVGQYHHAIHLPELQSRERRDAVSSCILAFFEKLGPLVPLPRYSVDLVLVDGGDDGRLPRVLLVEVNPFDGVFGVMRGSTGLFSWGNDEDRGIMTGVGKRGFELRVRDAPTDEKQYRFKMNPVWRRLLFLEGIKIDAPPAPPIPPPCGAALLLPLSEVDDVMRGLKEQPLNPNMLKWQGTWDSTCSATCCFSKACADIVCVFCSKSMLRSPYTRYFCLDCLADAKRKALQDGTDFHDTGGVDLCDDCWGSGLAHATAPDAEHNRWVRIDIATGKHTGVRRPGRGPLVELTEKELTLVPEFCSASSASGGDGEDDEEEKECKACGSIFGPPGTLDEDGDEKVQAFWYPNCATPLEHATRPIFDERGNVVVENDSPLCADCLLTWLRTKSKHVVCAGKPLPSGTFYCRPCARDAEAAGIRSELLGDTGLLKWLVGMGTGMGKGRKKVSREEAIKCLVACPSLGLKDVEPRLRRPSAAAAGEAEADDVSLTLLEVLEVFRTAMKEVHPQWHLCTLVDEMCDGVIATGELVSSS